MDSMIEISPKKIEGQWNEGFALDFHTISSDYIGDNEYGQPQFDTKRTALGDLLYRLKYGNDRSVLDVVVATTVEFIKSRSWSIELVIPIPPSRERSFQPVVAVAEGLAQALKVPCCGGCVVKIKEAPELKNIYDYQKRSAILSNAFDAVRSAIEGKNVLLFDDLYRSGATMNSVSSVVGEKGKAKVIYALALTMTRKRR